MLEYRHVCVSCDHTPILKDITVSFPKGQITVIIGPNGCGKTTLLQCLNGASRVTAGTITLDDRDYLSLPLRERAKKISFLPQVRTLIPSLPVKALVEHGRFPYLGFSRKKSAEDMALIEKAMEFTHVSEFAQQSVDTLSGGVRQRVFFAMTLAQNCDVLVLDEPTTYLDLRSQQDFLEMLKTLRCQGRTVILTLHDLNHALRIADFIVVMENRQLAGCGTPGEILEKELIERVFRVKSKYFEDKEGAYYFFE